MTEELLRTKLRQAVEHAAGVACMDRECPDAVTAQLVEHAEALVLPVVADLIQEALEQGFDGRADAEPPPCA